MGKLIGCWSIQGGSGASVVAAGMACALAAEADARRALLVDGLGDQPVLFGIEADGPGLADWLRAGEAVPPDGLARIEVAATPAVGLLTCGPGSLPTARIDVLASLLRADVRPVVIDAGTDEFGRALLAAVDASLLVVRACPVALARLRSLPAAPTGVVVVRGHRRTADRRAIARATGAPVVAEIDLDPAIGTAVDAGLARAALPRRFLRVLGEVA